MSGAAVDPDLADDRENQVFGRDARRQLALDIHGQRLWLALQQALRCQDMSDLRRPDTESQRTERAVGTGVTVATDDRLARLRSPKLGPDDVHDSPFAAAIAQQIEAELLAVPLHLSNLVCGAFTGDEQILERVDGRRRRGMVQRRQCQIRATNRELVLAQDGKCLRRSDFVNDVQIDIQDRRRIHGLFNDDMIRPYLLEQGRGVAQCFVSDVAFVIR